MYHKVLQNIPIYKYILLSHDILRVHYMDIFIYYRDVSNLSHRILRNKEKNINIRYEDRNIHAYYKGMTNTYIHVLSIHKNLLSNLLDRHSLIIYYIFLYSNNLVRHIRVNWYFHICFYYTYF